MPDELPRQARVPGMVVSGGKCKDEGGDRPLTGPLRTYTLIKSKSSGFVLFFSSGC